jgi:O-antigen/teichoic acid export membrane protein
MSVKEICKKLINNKIVGYVISRYATYFIQFVNSLFIAVYLGPYYLGIWGFITLIVQYMNQLSFGISHAANAIISIHKDKEWYVRKIIGASIIMLIGLSAIIVLLFIASQLFNIDIGNKYGFPQYSLAVMLIGILGYFNTLFSNVFRVYGKIFAVALNQSVFPVLMLFAIIFFRGENLLWALVISNLLAMIVPFFLFLIKMPIKIKPLFVIRLFKSIQIKGWYLFVYNTSFYLIIISTRSFISGYYSVEEFGYFTFVFSLAQAVLLLLESISFLVYPKLLNRLASYTAEKAITLLETVRNSYITIAHFLMHIVIFLFPGFLWLFPQYESTKLTFGLVLLTVVLYTNSFGYAGLLIAKRSEKILSFLAFLSLCINISMAFVLILLFKVFYSYVIMATMIAYLFFVFMLEYFGKKSLGMRGNFVSILKEAFPRKLFVPYILSVFLILFQATSIYFICPLLLFCILNYRTLADLRYTAKRIIASPDLVNI